MVIETVVVPVPSVAVIPSAYTLLVESYFCPVVGTEIASEVEVAVVEVESVTLTVILLLTAAVVGVPEITPVAAVKINPLGRAPFVTTQL